LRRITRKILSHQNHPIPTTSTSLCLGPDHPPGLEKKKEIQSPPHTEAQPIKPSINRLFNSCIPAATPSQNMTIKTVSKQRKAATHDIQVAKQWQQWEHLCGFHAGIRLWPADTSMQGIAGGSPLLEMMLSPPPATTRLPTYSWTEHGAVLPEIDGWLRQPCDCQIILLLPGYVEFEKGLVGFSTYHTHESTKVHPPTSSTGQNHPADISR